MKKEVVCIMIMIFVATSIDTVLAMRINEVMYNPEGDDNNKEFIEIFMYAPENLSGWIISDSASNDTLKAMQYLDHSDYALIVEEGFDFTGINASVYSAGATIGNNLDNSADSILLYTPNSTLVASALYNGSIANGNGKSIEFAEQDGVWGWFESIEIGGTPGIENSLRPANNQTMNQTSNDTGNQTINETSNSSVNGSDCGISFSVFTDNELYNNSEKAKIDFDLSGYDDNFTIEYWIEDLFGNIVKEKYNTTNTNQKTWTAETDKEDGSFYVIADLHAYCNNGPEIYSSRKLISVKGSPKPAESSISIKELYLGEDDSIEFGKAMRARIYIYKGDESSSTVEAWIEDMDSGEKISEVSKLTLYDKFRDYDLTVPIQIKNNCKEDYADGSYTLFVQGFNITETKEVRVDGIVSSLCPESSGSAQESKSSTAAESSISYEISDYDEEIEPGKTFTTSVKIKNDGSGHRFVLWSYVYRGSKCYSGDREENKIEIDLGPGEEKIIGLDNSVDDADTGEYKLKVSIQKDSQKTLHDITKDIFVNSPALQDNQTINQGIIDIVKSVNMTDAAPVGSNPSGDGQLKGVSGNMVYESPSSKAKGLAIYIIAAAMIVMGIIIMIGLKMHKKPA